MRLLVATVERLIVTLSAVVSTPSSLESLLHAQKHFFTGGLGWVLLQEVETFLSLEVIGDEVTRDLHVLKVLELGIDLGPCCSRVIHALLCRELAAHRNLALLGILGLRDALLALMEGDQIGLAELLH